MARVRLTADVEPELRRQVKVAAASSDKSVSEWVEEAVQDALDLEHDHLTSPQQGSEPLDSGEPIKLRGETLTAEARKFLSQKYPGMHFPPPGVKPKGLADPPRLREGSGTVADAVIEDRR